jgi:hydrogenase-4 component F
MDALSVIILDLVLVIGLLASIYSIGYMSEEMKKGMFDPGKLKIYYILMNAFIFTMVLALTAKNMGIMWIAIEATTLASVFCIPAANDTLVDGAANLPGPGATVLKGRARLR